MPMYEFKCSACGQIFDELLKSASSPLDDIVCPECGSKEVDRLISATSFGGLSSQSLGGSCGPLPSGGFG